MAEQTDEEHPNPDEYLASLLRGELPEELKTAFQQIDQEGFAAFLTIPSFAVAGSHEEFWERYTPAVNRGTLRRDSMRWMTFHMEQAWAHFWQEESSQIKDDDYRRRALHQILGSFLRTVDQVLHDPGREPD